MCQACEAVDNKRDAEEANPAGNSCLSSTVCSTSHTSLHMTIDWCLPSWFMGDYMQDYPS